MTGTPKKEAKYSNYYWYLFTWFLIINFTPKWSTTVAKTTWPSIKICLLSFTFAIYLRLGIKNWYSIKKDYYTLIKHTDDYKLNSEIPWGNRNLRNHGRHHSWGIRISHFQTNAGGTVQHKMCLSHQPFSWTSYGSQLLEVVQLQDSPLILGNNFCVEGNWRKKACRLLYFANLLRRTFLEMYHLSNIPIPSLQ